MSLPRLDSEAILQEVAGHMPKLSPWRSPAEKLDVICAFSGVDVACYVRGPLSQHLGISTCGPQVSMPISRVMYPGQILEHYPRDPPRSSNFAVVGNWRFNDVIGKGTVLHIANSTDPAVVAIDIMDLGLATANEIKRKMAELLPSHKDSAVISYELSSFGCPLAGQRCMFVARRMFGECLPREQSHEVDKCSRTLTQIVQSFCSLKVRSLKQYILKHDDDLVKFYDKLDAVQAGSLGDLQWSLREFVRRQAHAHSSQAA